MAEASTGGASGATRRSDQEVVQLPHAAERGRHRREVLQDDPGRMVQRELTAVLGGRQLQRQPVLRQHEEVEHAFDRARRVPSSIGTQLRRAAHFQRRFLKALLTKV